MNSKREDNIALAATLFVAVLFLSFLLNIAVAFTGLL